MAIDIRRNRQMGTAKKGRVARFIKFSLLMITSLAVILALTGLYFANRILWSNQAVLSGEVALSGLQAPVTIERDAMGVPTVRAGSRDDAARALGFLHGQERFFQMDTLRRVSAGELSELIGPATLKKDRESRRHRFRELAKRIVTGLDPSRRRLLDSYVEGVNQGLAALGGKPFEYHLLQVEPRPWQSEDTLLVVYAMFLDLQDILPEYEATAGIMQDLLPEEMYAFLTQKGAAWDAPLLGPPTVPLPAPGPEVFNTRGLNSPALEQEMRNEGEDARKGSNNWAVGGELTRHGGAMLANDMHLTLAVPNTWYRASMEWPAGNETLKVTGTTLPGTPSVVTGSNGHVAWGFTNSYGDWADMVLLEPDPADPENKYLTPEGPRAYEVFQEKILIKDSGPETLEVRWTIWGPVCGQDHRGQAYALRWVAHDMDAVSLELLNLETARDVDQALAVGVKGGIPNQNLVVADRDGRIGWTIFGKIPRRVGFDGSVPKSWANGDHYWAGWLPSEAYPRVVNPESGRIWTANNRVIGGAMLEQIGYGGYAYPNRAVQIRDRLFEREKFEEADLLAIQLDDEARYLNKWRDLVMSALTPEARADHPLRQAAYDLITMWEGHASVDSAAFRVLLKVRASAITKLTAMLTMGCETKSGFLAKRVPQKETPIWTLLEDRPFHFIPPGFESWDDFILSLLDENLEELTAEGGALADQTWGLENAPKIQHPISLAVPFLSQWLDMPVLPLPGSAHTPRTQSGKHGASERMVVSPGHEADGIFHMPGGQSGHPFSPYYAAGHEAWVKGEPTPFLPGPTTHTLKLAPKGN